VIFIKNLSPKLKCVIATILLIILTFGIVIVINESYKVGKGYITLWEPADTLGFYGSYLSFLGTVILGIVAIYQNKKSQDLNEKLEKLQQAQFISMVSTTKVMIETRSSSTPYYMNLKMPDINVIDLTANGFSTDNCYHIDVEFKNDSEYPIVQMKVHPGERTNGNCLFYGMKSLIDQAVYIAKGESAYYRFIIPSKIFEKTQQYKLQLCITFINVFDYATPSTLYITDLQNKNHRNEYQYRLSKFIDVRPSKN